MFFKEKTEAVKNIFDILKQFLFAVVISWFVFMPDEFRDFFHRRKISIQLPGVKYEEQLQDSNASVQVANMTNTSNEKALKELQTQLESAKSELVTLRGQLVAGSMDGIRASGAGPEAAAGTPTARLESLIKAVGDASSTANSALERSSFSSQILQGVLEENATVLRENASSTKAAVSWLVVFGSDKDERSARDELGRAASKGLPEGVILKRAGLFHSALRFDTEADAKARLPAVRSLSRYSEGAFVVSLSSFCAGGVAQIDKVLQCLTAR